MDELCRAKVAKLVQSYLEAEVDELLGRLRYERRDGKRIGFRDGHDPERTVTASIGPIAIRRPRVRGVAHESALVPKYRRRLPSIDTHARRRLSANPLDRLILLCHKQWISGIHYA